MVDSSSAPSPDIPYDDSVESLMERELGLEHGSIPREGQNRVLIPPGDLVGLSLSGGGIRSATFNLGVLQGLHDVGLLGRLDYLSTVSGGGYIGSFWTAWRSRPDSRGRTFPEHGPDEVEAPEIRHLREFGGFLIPRMGLLNWDTGRVAVAATGSMLPSLLAAISVIALAFMAWSTGVRLLFASGPTVSVAVMACGVALLLGLAEALYRRRQERSGTGAYVLGSILAVVIVSVAWIEFWALWPALQKAYVGAQRLPVIRAEQRPVDWLYLIAPSLVLVVGAAVFGLRRWLWSRFERSEVRRGRRAAFDRVHGWLLFAAVSWLVIATMWYAGALTYGYVRGEGLRGTALGAATASAVGAFAWVHGKLNGAGLGALRGRVMVMLSRVLPKALAYVAVGLLTVSTVAGLIAAEGWLAGRADGGADAGWGPLLIPAIVCTSILLAVLVFMDPNEVGLHAFYKGRIARAFLGASNRAARASAGSGAFNRVTEEQPGDDVRFADRPGPTGHPTTGTEPTVTRSRPVHLVCCAANDLASDPVATLNRGAESAVLSHAGFSVGREWAPWEAQLGAPTLAHAVTASGAAFNSLMGAYSVQFGPAATFLMAALNLRLGIWLPHPTRSPLHRRRNSRLRRWLVGLPYFRELAGLARAGGDDVHLSDGGHFENLGTYELIRRHCRFIIASDSSADAAVGFNDFGNLVRRVREDFGVDIRIDLSPLRPDPVTGLARQPMVAGDIHYPEGDTGVLLLIKPSITGNEPADIAQYRTRNPVFPHETTLDQFFDEAQWESYRRLGQHCVHAAFHPVLGGIDSSAPDYVGQLFARARREWLPRPIGFEDRLARFTDRVAQLDTMLRQPGCELLLRQVYREVDDHDRDARRIRISRVVGPDGAVAPEELPTGTALAASLHAMRLALLIMDEIFEAEGLEARHAHPLYLGVMNYFARWASAPLFRMWWPVLKALYPQPFTRFMEAQFGLSGVGAMDGGPAHVEQPDVAGHEHDAGKAEAAWEEFEAMAGEPQAATVGSDAAESEAYGELEAAGEAETAESAAVENEADEFEALEFEAADFEATAGYEAAGRPETVEAVGTAGIDSAAADAEHRPPAAAPAPPAPPPARESSPAPAPALAAPPPAAESRPTPPHGAHHASGQPGRAAREIVKEMRSGEGGFAWDCWIEQGNHVPPGCRVIAYELPLRYPVSGTTHTVQAAQVIVDIVGDAMAWDAEDFFVPPGLWGMGIGEDFLRRLGGGELASHPITQLYVRVKMHTSAGTGAANQIQLYRAAGFQEIRAGAVPIGVVRALQASRPMGESPDVIDRWMTRAVTPASAPVQHAGVAGTSRQP